MYLTYLRIITWEFLRFVSKVSINEFPNPFFNAYQLTGTPLAHFEERKV